jgi:hypothetical protein
MEHAGDSLSPTISQAHQCNLVFLSRPGAPGHVKARLWSFLPWIKEEKANNYAPRCKSWLL